jgi:branched-chain amino acid transport system permease protein
VDYALHISVLVTLWATLALSQGLITGYLGVLAVHQAAAWALGAYTAALLDRLVDAPLAVAILPAALVAGLVMLVLGRAVGSARRDDQVVASLCIQILVIQSLLNFQPLTGGPFGIGGIGSESLSQGARAFASFVWSAALLACVIGFYFWLQRTRVPASWIMVRDDRAWAESFGIDVGGARAQAMFAAGLFAGAAGAVFAHYLTYIEPSTFGLPESVAMLAIAVIGRAPHVVGVLMAAIIIITLPEALRSIGLSASAAANIRQALFGLFLIVAMFRGRAS